MTASQQPIDPDILAIQRGRRQRAECLKCGAPSARREGRPPALCAVCIRTWAYCPSCERLHGRRAALKASFATDYCPACRTACEQASGRRQPYAEYLARVRARRHAVLPILIKHYRAGETAVQIAAAAGIEPRQVGRMISDARKSGEWPAGLRRHQKKASKA